MQVGLSQNSDHIDLVLLDDHKVLKLIVPHVGTSILVYEHILPIYKCMVDHCNKLYQLYQFILNDMQICGTIMHKLIQENCAEFRL